MISSFAFVVCFRLVVSSLHPSGPEYERCVTQKLMTYALGRTASNDERCVIAAIGEQAVAADSKFSDLLWAIVTSDAFQRQEAEEAQ
jgi:hypothetical protein